jgi:pimeloyl-ACP methyl ester carboxylesterase
MGTYVLVHGAWHTGKELEPVAISIRATGHQAFTPTIKGNRPGDPKTIGLAEAIQSIVDYLVEDNLKDIVLVGHSYGGMIITGVANSVPERIRRLVYWNAFVPNDGESLYDMVRRNMSRCSMPLRPSGATVASSSRFRSGAKRSSTMPTSTPRNVRTTS